MQTINKFSGSYDFLSNFYFCNVEFEGLCYRTAESAFQAAKTMDNSTRQRFCGMEPGTAKKYGRRLALRSDWERVKDDIMYKIVKNKFSAPKLKAKLFATRNMQLAEGNLWHDNEWGDCACAKCVGTPGKNKLGKILMNIRAEFNCIEEATVTRMENDLHD